MMRRLLALALALLLALPPCLLLLTSLARSWRWPDLLPAQWQTLQWVSMLGNTQQLGKAALTSAVTALCVGLVATALGFPTSARLARHPHGHRVLALIHLPYAVSPVVLGVSLLYLGIKLRMAGTLFGVIAVQLIFAYAYAVILMSRFWSPRVTALEDLARTLGASPWQVLRRATLPLAAPLLMVCFFQTFLISWFDYALSLLMGFGQVETLPILLFQYFRSGDIGLASTCALILTTPPLVLLLLDRRLDALPSPAFPLQSDPRA